MSITIQRSPYLVNKEYRDNAEQTHSNHSYILGNKVTQLYNENSWKNQSCFIVAGGPSLVDFDYSRLQGKFTIGINKSFLAFSPSILYAMDSTFYGEMIDGNFDEEGKERTFVRWLKCPSTKVLLTPMELKKFGQEVFLIRRKWKAEVNRENLDDGIWGGQNSGVGAINLAIALGANPIYLLGYDLQCKERTHGHSGYKDFLPDETGKSRLVPRDPIRFNLKLQEFKTEIEELSPIWKEAGIKIINLNPNSALTCFPFDDIDKVLGEKSANI